MAAAPNPPNPVVPVDDEAWLFDPKRPPPVAVVPPPNAVGFAAPKALLLVVLAPKPPETRQYVKFDSRVKENGFPHQSRCWLQSRRHQTFLRYRWKRWYYYWLRIRQRQLYYCRSLIMKLTCQHSTNPLVSGLGDQMRWRVRTNRMYCCWRQIHRSQTSGCWIGRSHQNPPCLRRTYR